MLEEDKPGKEKENEEKQEPVSRTFKNGDRIRVEVIAVKGHRFTLRVLESDHNEEIIFERIYWNKRVGEKLRVRVNSVGPDGQIQKINP